MREFIVGALNDEMGLQAVDPELAAAKAGGRMPAITSFICATSRSPSRISTSWFSMKTVGCPASEGICAICELPPGP